MSAEIVVVKAPDKVILEVIRAIEERFELRSKRIEVSGVVADPLPEGIANSRTATYGISSIVLLSKNDAFEVRLSRNYNSSPYFDVFTITPKPPANGQAKASVMWEVGQIISSRASLPNGAKEFAQTALTGAIEKEISDLAILHRNFIDDAQKLRADYEEEDLERRKQFRDEAAAERKRIAESEQESLESIARKQAELDTRLSEFDISDHMRARRTLREQITKEIQDSLRRPASSIRSDFTLYLLVIACVAAIAASGYLAYESFQSFITLASSSVHSGITDSIVARLLEGDKTAVPELRQTAIFESSSYLLWMLAIRGFLLSAVAVAFAYYLVSLFRKNYDEDIRSIRELQRYGMDINRASWIIETAMEMTTKENAQLPDKWIEGACAGLFLSEKRGEPEVSALNALGALLQVGPELEAGPNGVTVKLNKSASRATAKSSE